MHDLFQPLIHWYLNSLDTGGYWAVAFFMALESSIIPLPSEVIIPPAVVLAQRSGNMSIAGIVLAGAVGSWAGATVMYWVARWAGRPLVMRYGKFVFIPESKVIMAEAWAAEYGSFGIFASRLLPVVRHLIGIPAGIVKMSYARYAAFTLLGSAMWCSVLSWVGVKAGQDEALMKGEMHRIVIWITGAIVVLGAIYYVFVHRVTRRKKA